MQNLNKPAMGHRNRSEFFQTTKFPLERSCVLELSAVDDLYGAVNPNQTLAEPDFAIRAAANEPDKFMVSNDPLLYFCGDGCEHGRSIRTNVCCGFIDRAQSCDGT